jgi:2'-5' RNA ligase
MRPFHPHITLARRTGNKGTRDQGIKKTGPHAPDVRAGHGGALKELVARAGAAAFTRFTAREFLLYESHLGAERARYEVRGRFPLIGPGGDV